MADDLSRQANELAALSAMYGSAEGESFTVGEIPSTGELACTLTVGDASLSVELPQGYPSAEPPRVSVSCPIMPTASREELTQELDQIAADGAATDLEGEAAACAEYVGELRALRWQAMEVRWEATDLPTDAPLGLPEPFAELAESAMGEAAALCEKAGLLAAFRTAVLKLEKG